MATLNKRQKLFLLEQLACFESQKETIGLFREEFGIEITKQQVWSYDASNLVARERLVPEFVELFDRIREDFTKDLSRHAIAHQAYRLKQLDRMFKGTQGTKVKAALLRQAAEEVGGAYTNKHELSGPGGTAIPVNTSYDFSRLSLEEHRELERALARAAAAEPGANPGEP